MRGALALVLALAMFVSGCITEDAAQEPAGPDTPELIVDEDRPDAEYGIVVTGPAVGPDLDATTAAAPRLVLGEWWRIRFDNVLDGELIEVVRVVADVNEEGYIFGMPHSGWLKEAIAFHSPAFGDVTPDLAYNTHNVLFEPVRFPLEEGATWETVFATTPFTATVTEADETTATIEFVQIQDDDPTRPLTDALGLSGAPQTMRLLYDAQQHEIVKMESFIGTWEVVEHGYGFEGWVTVPRGEHTAIDYGTFGPASDTHTPAARTVTVEGGFNRLTMMHLVGGLGPGQYHVRDVTPDGTEFFTRSGGEAIVRFYEASDPDGDWTVEDFVGGPGFTYSMGIAYHQYDIKLPEGTRRADHSHPVIR